MNKALNLLQVEDSESDAALIVGLLEIYGYDVHAERVETAAGMRAALESQSWDAITADYHLPEFDALSALLVLRASHLDIPFIVVSGAVGEDLAVSMMKAGAHDYVRKDSLTRLVPAVEREIQEAKMRRERQSAENALRLAHRETERSRQLLDAVFTAQTDAVIVYNTAGVAIRTNPAAAAIYGFDPTGMGIAQILETLQVSPGPGSAIRRALAGETARQLEVAAADRILDISSVPMRDTTGRIIGAVTVLRDISRKKLDEQRLLQAQKLESIALLAGGIAHDFNNILTVVSGNISLALQDSRHDGETIAVLSAALESLDRAASLTRQLLAYSGKGAFVHRPVSISGVAGESVAHLRPSLPESIRLAADLAPDLLTLLMDPGQIEQVFSNLLLNAVEAIPSGQPGLVTVRTGIDPDGLEIEVGDNGCGIAPETQKRIFDPFFTTKFPGRGLGLAAVEGIVRSLNGRIAVDSAIGHGTRIRVVLPVPKTAPPAAAPVAASAAGYGAVLIVDDEAMVRKMAAAFLQKHGIRVLEAGSGKEAIDLLASEGAAVRAILLDIAMPELPGGAVLPLVRRLRPDIRVIVSSGSRDGDVPTHLSNIEAFNFLPKPYTLEQLLAVVVPAVAWGEKSQ